jgi:hypothetical protein
MPRSLDREDGMGGCAREEQSGCRPFVVMVQTCASPRRHPSYAGATYGHSKGSAGRLPFDALV